jgi:hypothetical protein
VNAKLRQSASNLSVKLEILQDLSNKIQDEELQKFSRRFALRREYKKIPFHEAYRNLLLRQTFACDKLLSDNKVDVVVVCEDGPGGCAPLIAAAKRRHILVAEMPFGIGEMRDYEIFIDAKASENTLNLVPDDEVGAALRKISPHWIKKTTYGDITLFPADTVLARTVAGMDLPEPWVVHGGSADVLLVESEAMERIYQRENVPRAKRIMTGSCYADVVYDEIAAKPELQKAYEASSLIEPEKPRILIALPPSYHQEYGGKSEFPTYREVIEKLLVGCREVHSNARITVSIHPAIKADDRQIIETLADEVSDEWLLRLIPKNDVFVPVFSSTIRWALMCGKPVVNYDIYKLDLPTYDTARCVYTTPVLQDALARLKETLENPEKYHAAAMQVKACSNEWGIMDGQNFDRIWATLQKRRGSMAGLKWLHWMQRFNILAPS